MRVLIVGAGGHGEVVADAMRAMRLVDIAAPEAIGFLDDDGQRWGTMCGGLPVLGGIAMVGAIPHDRLIVAIGDNHSRYVVMRDLMQAEERFVSVVHPSAVIAPSAEIGPGTMICAGAVVNPGARLGMGDILNTCASIDHHCQVEAFAHVAPGAHTGGGVVIGEGVFVGMGAHVMPRCHIGDWATVGAGATVIRDVPAGVTVVGTPAHVITEMKEPG